jgi:hypothetical protein
MEFLKGNLKRKSRMKKTGFTKVIEKYEDEISITIQAFKKCCNCGIMKKDTASKKNMIILKNNPLSIASVQKKTKKNGKSK